MYRTCLFCQADLGANESVEHLPIGRRLAFDQGKGRLWVVCRKCERWNLTPFDDRWEAIEECERLFRGTTMRLSTDEVGLARLREGTELVRIGEPLRPEFAAWRYGDQFGRRRRRHLAWVGVGSAAVIGLMVAPQLLGLSVGGGGMWNIYNGVYQSVRARRTVLRLPLADGGNVALSRDQVEKTRLIPVAGQEGVELHIPSRKRDWRGRSSGDLMVLEGERAHLALQKLLPKVNHQGATKAAVQTAVGFLEEAPSTEAMLARLAQNAHTSWKEKKGHDRTLRTLKPELRLALEMTAHEDAERRWLAGELLDLEQAWRDAEELAAIADTLGIPAEVESRLEQLRTAAGRPEKEESR